MRKRADAAELVHLSKAKDNGAGSLENPNGNFPAPQDFYNLDADYGLSGYDQPYNNTTELRVGAAVRPRASSWVNDANAFVDALRRRLDAQRHQQRRRPASR